MLSAVLLAKAQVNSTVEEKMVKMAEQAGNRIQNLITAVQADENATAKIQNVNLTEQFEDNVTLYQNEGLNKLTQAQDFLAKSNYNLAADSALEALKIFREVYGSLQEILKTAGIQDASSIDSQGLIDAINRELQRLNTIRNLLPLNASQETLNLLETANNTLLEAKTAVQEGKNEQAQVLYLEARQHISQIYQLLKIQAEENNVWRLSGYCERLQQRIQEKFRYGSQNGINFTETLQALGYQNEDQFMQALQNRIQNAQSQEDIKKAVQECLSIDQMVQQMEQALNNEISRQQGPNPSNGKDGTSGSDNGAGGNYTGNGAGSGKSGKP